MITNDRPRINGLLLPQALLDLIAAGRWRSPDDQSKIDRVFPDRGELHLYSLDYMPFENMHWADQTEPMFIGVPDSANPPGDIDPRQSVLVGDLGIGYDQPIALDYRASSDTPRVLTLQWTAYGKENRWVEVAANIDQLAEMLGL
jgi:hypothetical protein